MKRTIIAALTLATISTSALAGNPWVKVGTDTNGAELYYNPTTIGKVGQAVTVRTMNVYRASMVTTQFIYCNRWTHVTMYADGNISNELYITPSEPLNKLAEKVCK